MLERGKISAGQMGVIMYPTLIGTAILYLPSGMAAAAQNDLWLSPVFASMLGFLIVYIVDRLHRLYPRQTIIEYSEHIVGRVPGKILGAMYCLLYLQWNAEIVRFYADFIKGIFLMHTPISVIIGSMTFLCACAVRGGLEGLARMSQLILPVMVLPVLTMIILLLPDMEPRNLFPVLENGLIPPLRGAIPPTVWFGEFMMISFLLPYLTDGRRGLRWGMYSVLAVTITMIAMNLFTLFLFGGEVGSMLYPVMTASRYISIANFLENLESVAMALWVLGAFLKISVFFYVIVLGSAQVMNVSDYRILVWPIGLLTVLFSFWGIPNLMVYNQFPDVSEPYYGFLLQILAPCLLLLIALWRKKRGRRARR